jgi:hypothetical protein
VWRDAPAVVALHYNYLARSWREILPCSDVRCEPTETIMVDGPQTHSETEGVVKRRPPQDQAPGCSGSARLRASLQFDRASTLILKG